MGFQTRAEAHQLTLMTFWSRGSPAPTLRTSESSLSLRTVCITRHQWDSGAPRGSNGERGSIECLQWQRGGINSINKSLILCPTEKKKHLCSFKANHFDLQCLFPLCPTIQRDTVESMLWVSTPAIPHIYRSIHASSKDKGRHGKTTRQREGIDEDERRRFLPW